MNGYRRDYIDTFLAYIDFASEDSKEIPYFYSDGLKLAGIEKQEDLAYGQGLLLSEGASTQANGFYFLRDLLIKYHNTILLKPLNIEHQPNLIVGSVYDVALTKRPSVQGKYNPLDYLILPNQIHIDKDNATIEGYDGPIDMWIGFLIYKRLFPDVFDYIKVNKDKMREDAALKGYQLGLSMEIWYNKYGYLFDLDESTLQIKDEKNAFFDDYIGKEWNGRKVYKVYLDKIIFAGSALTEAAAEKRSFLLDVASKSYQNFRGGDNSMEEFELTLYNEVNDIKVLQNEETDGEFHIDLSDMDDENLSSLLEVAKEEDDELVKLLDEAVRISKKKEGHRSKPKKYKDVPLSQFADPTNYKYPLNSPKRVRAAIVYFTRYGGRYTPAEQKTIWRKILRAAKKFGIKVSEKVRQRAKGSEENKREEVNTMIVDTIKEYFEGFQKRLDSFVKDNKIDEAAVKALIAEEKLNMVLKEVEAKDKANAELQQKLEETSAKIEELEKAKEELEKSKEELEKSKEELEKKIKSLEEDLASYKKREIVEQRLTELKESGIQISEDKIEKVVEKASTYSDEEWKQYVDALQDVAAIKKEEKKDTSSQKDTGTKKDEKTTLIELGKMIMSDSSKNPVAQKDTSSTISTVDDEERSKKRIEGFAKNFALKK